MKVREHLKRPLPTAAIWIPIGFVIALMLAATVPYLLGDRSYVVRSGSMAPAIETGDVVVVEPISPTDATVGDIVTFTDPGGRLISHRARAIDQGDSTVRFTTQGDANNTQEHWQVAAEGRIGRVAYRVPKLGFVVAWIQTTPGRMGLLVVPALALGISLLHRIWRRPQPEEALDEPAL